MLVPLLLASVMTTCSTGESAQALRAMHEMVLVSHRTNNVDEWMDMEADTLIVGSRGEVTRSGPERRDQRTRYLGATTFE